MWPFKKKPPKKRIVRKQKYRKAIQKIYDISFVLTNGTTYNTSVPETYNWWKGDYGFDHSAVWDKPFSGWRENRSLTVFSDHKNTVELNTDHIIRVDWKEASYTEITVPDGYEEVEE